VTILKLTGWNFWLESFIFEGISCLPISLILIFIIIYHGRQNQKAHAVFLHAWPALGALALSVSTLRTDMGMGALARAEEYRKELEASK
jgi:hypothetical protein